MDDIQKIKQKIDIVDLISDYIALKKSGRNFKANCPFHSEKSPSFVISPERQIWHCFGCQKGGDIFSFIESYEKIEFPEALKYLADRAGVKLETTVEKSDKENKKERIYELNHLAYNFYSFLLFEHKAGKKALSYLVTTRKIPSNLAKKFGLGFAPNQKSALCGFLIKKKGYREQDILDAGLATKQGGILYDFFRNRIIFPIFDTRGNIIAFSGRGLTDANQPKYINTRETLVYKKGDTLFGINFAKDEIKKEKKVIIVEGEFDVISSFREGIKNIVAIKGTALTESQIKTLKRFAGKLILCFDADRAGREAQRRSIELIEKEGLTATVILPPSGKDLDGLSKEDPVLFKKAIRQDINIFEFIIDSAISEFDKNNPEDKRKILEITLPYLVLIENEVIKEHFLRKLAQKLDSSFEAILKQSEKIKNKIIKPEIKEQSAHPNREDAIEPYLLSLILQAEDIKKAFEESKKILSHLEFLLSAPSRIYKITGEALTNGETKRATDIVKNLPSELIETFDKFYLAPMQNFEDKEKYFLEIKKTAREVKINFIKNSVKKISDDLKISKNNAEKEEELKNKFKALTDLLKEVDSNSFQTSP